MKTLDKIEELFQDLKVLYHENLIRYKRINEYIESLGLEPGHGLLEYPKGPRYHISDFMCKINYMQILGDMRETEINLINEAEKYLRVECYVSYIINNLEEKFERARQDDNYRLEALEIIKRILFNA